MRRGLVVMLAAFCAILFAFTGVAQAGWANGGVVGWSPFGNARTAGRTTMRLWAEPDGRALVYVASNRSTRWQVSRLISGKPVTRKVSRNSFFATLRAWRRTKNHGSVGWLWKWVRTGGVRQRFISIITASQYAS